MVEEADGIVLRSDYGKSFRAFIAPIDKGVINLSINRFKMLSRYRRYLLYARR